jgi:hypothetical protein
VLRRERPGRRDTLTTHTHSIHTFKFYTVSSSSELCVPLCLNSNCYPPGFGPRSLSSAPLASFNVAFPLPNLRLKKSYHPVSARSQTAVAVSYHLHVTLLFPEFCSIGSSAPSPFAFQGLLARNSLLIWDGEHRFLFKFLQAYQIAGHGSAGALPLQHMQREISHSKNQTTP